MAKCEPAHFGHLPIWAEGNVYLGGAKADRHEKNGLTIEKESGEVRAELAEKDGSCYLDTNIYELLKGFTGRMVHTEMLGTAFEPEQRFENPDGTPIRFDTDYLGEHRGVDVIPGPFADAPEKCRWIC
ncbi:MAG: hypothetical protein LUH07_16215 [Lachnospiraceae bacterium]|nr:hypothetical protein [Lachnospiraceae bacterium]